MKEKGVKCLVIARFETHSHLDTSNIRLIDSINKPKKLIKTAFQKGYSGIAITDHEFVGNMVDVLNAEKELKESGEIDKDFKVALGNEIYLTSSREKEKIEKYFHFLLIAKDTKGHEGLRKLSSNSWYNSFIDRGMWRVPTTKKELTELMKEYKGHIIADTACIGNEIFYCLEQEDYDRIDNFVEHCLELFGTDFYFEIAPSDSADQTKYNKFIKYLAKKYNVKIVIGTDAHYYTKEDRFVHKSFLLSKDESGLRETDDFYSYTYLMSNQEVENILTYFTKEELEQFYSNSLEIRDKIKTYDVFHTQTIPQENVTVYDKGLCPEFTADKYPTVRSFLDGDDIQNRYWANECYNGLKEKNIFDEDHLARIEKEADILNVISGKLGVVMSSYHNTLKQYIDMMWEEGSVVGPGRGSSVGFLSNYCLGITQLDPLPWGLAEWRYLNKERIELGDIDLDQSPSKRKQILKRIRERKGGDTRVLQVATFGTVSTKSAILTACRGYRLQDEDGKELYPEGIDIDTAQYMSSLIEQERGFLWPLQDCFYGNEEKGRKPNQALINEVNKYPRLQEIMFAIEGLIDKRGTHASGVIIYDVEPWHTNAVMRAPDGSLTTQMSLKTSEAAGDLKYDFLVTDMCDKIGMTLQLLQEYGYIDKSLTLRQAYDKYIHPNVINLKDERIWDALGNNKVINIFQFNTGVGLDTALLIKPKTPLEMTCCNGLLRLTAEKGKERPLNKYYRFRNNIQLWYDEMSSYGLTEEEQKELEPYLLVDYGVTPYQECLMRVLMDENIAHFSLKEANTARKICAKKQLNKIPALKQQIFDYMKGKEKFATYVWECIIEPQMSYSFSINHSLPYSFVGLQGIVLALDFPQVFWNTANLIIDSGGIEEEDEEEEETVSLYEPEDWEDYEYEDLPDRSGKKKKKIKTVNYGKISTAIGKFKTYGINVAPPDINVSTFTFTPVVETNTIRYGLRGISRISTDLVNTIIANRPYTSLADFLARVPTNKIQATNLIKCGAFDDIEKKPREEIMRAYINSIADHKDKLTLQNMPILFEKDLLPEEVTLYRKLFFFNKHLKADCKCSTYYELGEREVDFIAANLDMDILTDGNKVMQKTWDNTYKKAMEPMRVYLKEHSTELLDKLNNVLYNEEADKYATGNISKWEMESLSFYYHKHELDYCSTKFDNFFDLPEQPVVERTFTTKDDATINIYQLSLIAGTVIDRNKMKNTITLLTQNGVVNVKIYKNQFAMFDKQISFIDDTGKKKVLERSWFARGTLLMVQGFRRGQDFVPKKYKSSIYPVISKINGVGEFGLDVQYERVEG